MKKLSLLFSLILSVNTILSKDIFDPIKASERNYCINGELKYNYQKSSGIEVGINFTKYPGFPKKGLFEAGIYLSCEYKVLGKNNCFAPKLGLGITELDYKFNGFGYCAKLNTVLYTTSEKSDLRLLPEVGISYLGLLNITYGHSLPLSKSTIPAIANHVISCGVNIGYKRTIINIMDMSYGTYDRKRFGKHKK